MSNLKHIGEEVNHLELAQRPADNIEKDIAHGILATWAQFWLIMRLEKIVRLNLDITILIMITIGL